MSGLETKNFKVVVGPDASGLAAATSIAKPTITSSAISGTITGLLAGGNLYLSSDNAYDTDDTLLGTAGGAYSFATPQGVITGGNQYYVILKPTDTEYTNVASTQSDAVAASKLASATCARTADNALTWSLTNVKDQWGKAFTITQNHVATLTADNTAGMSDNDTITLTATTTASGTATLTLARGTKVGTIATGTYINTTDAASGWGFHVVIGTEVAAGENLAASDVTSITFDEAGNVD